MKPRCTATMPALRLWTTGRASITRLLERNVVVEAVVIGRRLLGLRLAGSRARGLVLSHWGALLARCAIAATGAERPRVVARCASNLSSPPGRRELLPVSVGRQDGEWVARATKVGAGDASEA